MRRIPHFLLLFLFFSSALQAQKFVNEFLNIGAGARAHGMSEAVIASGNDGTSGFWNPAGMSGLQSSLQVNAMHAEWFAGIANYDYISAVKRFNEEKKSFGGISIIRFGVDNIPYTLNLIGPDGSVNYDNVTSFSAIDYAIFLSYSQQIINEKISVGGNIKIINRNVGKFGNAYGFGADIGALYKEKRFTFALMAKDITTTYNTWSFNYTEEEKNVFASTGNEIPISSTEISLPSIIIGAAFHNPTSIELGKYQYTIETNIKFTSDSRISGLGNKNINIDPSIGLEVGYSNLVFIRGGFGDVENKLNAFNASRTLSIQPNVGLGLNLGRIGVDYALTNIGSLGNENSALYSHIFSLRLNFDPIKNKE